MRVDRLDQLFDAGPFRHGDRAPRVEAALDEAYAVVRHSDRRAGVRLRIEAPEHDDSVDPDRVGSAVATYCALRAAAVDREHRAATRDGRSALLVGLIILAVGLLVSQAIHRTSLPEELTTVLADGLFLVVAWVGLWYPIDTLLYTRREIRHRAEAWHRLGAADLDLRRQPDP